MTSLLYKLDTLLLKQKKLSVLDITGCLIRSSDINVKEATKKGDSG
jgi:hypothetical protein